MFTELTAEEVSELYEKDEIVLIDVRTTVEFSSERIRGALNAPMATLEPAKLPCQAEKRIVLHCGSGMRSQKIAELCLEAGFSEIAHMKGGLGAWKKEGLDTVSIDPISGNLKV